MLTGRTHFFPHRPNGTGDVTDDIPIYGTPAIGYFILGFQETGLKVGLRTYRIPQLRGIRSVLVLSAAIPLLSILTGLNFLFPTLPTLVLFWFWVEPGLGGRRRCGPSRRLVVTGGYTCM